MQNCSKAKTFYEGSKLKMT